MNHRSTIAARNHSGVAGPLVVIMSGVPGSGKSTYARSIAAAISATNAKIVSADDCFTKPNGTYDFHARDLPAAHAACLRAFNGALRDMRSSNDLLVVDNTNTTAVEIAPYYALATAYGNAVHIVTLECDPAVAAARNTHDVSLASIERMAAQIRDRRLPPYWLASLFTQASEA
jgi:predicted kinase